MATTNAFARTYIQLESITKATVSLHAEGISNDELASVAGRLAQVVKIKGDNVTLQVFAGTEGIPTNAEVKFFGEAPSLKVSDELSGRFRPRLKTGPPARRKRTRFSLAYCSAAVVNGMITL